MSLTAPSLATIRVADVRRPSILSCSPDTPLGDVAKMLSDRRVHCLMVGGVRETSTRAEVLTWRVVTALDLVKAALRPEPGTVAADAAATELLTVDEDDTLDVAAGLLAEHDVNHLLVLRDDRPVGVISDLDVATMIHQIAIR